MFSRTRICTALLAAMAANAWAQNAPTDTSTQRVEITGSAIRRVESEGALPVTVISRDAIDKTGALSITELIQKLPAMTGGNFQQSSSSVNGNGNGTTTAAIHGLDQKYTLVLLNGRRVAPFGGFGSSGGDGSVNLESLPLDAIERVEVLTDGASALYGSDAIAGVVNFITKKNQTDAEVSFNGTRPTKAGGSKWSAGISKGFGDFDKDRNNLLLSYSHDVQNKLMASQREVSRRGGLIPVTIDGQSAELYQPSSNSLPANIYLDSGTKLNPYLAANGNCGPNPVVFASGTRCFTNYAATVQDIPGSKRDSVFITDHFKVNENTTLFAEALWSKFDMTAGFAPSAQPMGLGTEDLPGQPLNNLWQKYVVPYQTASGDTSTGASLHYRSFDGGDRTDEWETISHHYVLGAEGTAMNWDYTASVTLSSNQDQDKLVNGYLDFTKFVNLISSGAYDPIVPIAGQSLASAELHGTFLKTKISQDVFSLHASRDLFTLPGGTSSLALGVDVTRQKLTQDTSAMAEFGNGTAGEASATDYAVGGFYGYVPMSASRRNYGAFAELLMPIAKKTELTGSVRFDRYDRVKNDEPFTQVPNNLTPLPSQEEGNSFSHPTFKLSFRSQPVDMLLLRGSFGTGFKAPSVNQIAAPLAFSTNTSGSYACPFPGTPVCVANGTDPEQWDLISSGNPASGSGGLKAETSHQWTLGGRLEPAKGLSFGLDYWGVKLKNQILAGIPEGYAFANAASLGSLFVNPYRDPSGPQTIGLIQKPFNAGSADYRGLDWEFNVSEVTPIGRLSADLSGTHMLKADYNLPGGRQTDLGRFGGDNNVVFRDIFRLTLGMQTGDFTNTLSVNYKSGYKDQAFTADSGNVLAVGPDGSLGDGVAYNGRVSAYTTADWQTRWEVTKQLRLTFGINNIFDAKPPLSLKIVGGNQVGYDGRYADPTGCAVAVGATYRF
ncbi:TonB-dependent receptor domain-containing protein [Scleromatobacter humisilvae]|uniref:TonB-dependent receptor n=1 Tax=Scleromatobacter humisilvae TaxID=2897159 RepID=A0A9X1YFF2_9BURK|nr:TonB-dependent receptor [Scleromatobacter humisilvae]MCK9684465.1 TonB-dependent receptor [Scleromatobacter humisilvae]